MWNLVWILIKKLVFHLKCVVRFTLFHSFRSGCFFLVERYLLPATGVLSVFFVRSSLHGRGNRCLPSSLCSQLVSCALRSFRHPPDLSPISGSRPCGCQSVFFPLPLICAPIHFWRPVDFSWSHRLDFSFPAEGLVGLSPEPPGTRSIPNRPTSFEFGSGQDCHGRGN
jgi:hypothetical protein